VATTKTYAKRYAQAIFQIALEKQEMEKWRADLDMVVGLGQNTDLVSLLKNPNVPFEDKSKLLSTFLAGASPSTLKLVYLLVSRDKLHLVNDIRDEYQRLLDSYYGIEPAVVVTAIAIDEETKAGFEKLAARIGGRRSAR